MSLGDLIGKIELEDAVELTTRALDLIGNLTGNPAAATAVDVVVLVQNIYKAVVDTAEQKITPQEAHKELEKLENLIAGSDTAADAALDAKFGDSEDTDPGQDDVDAGDSEE
ncbi:hypothetical protein LCGC14_2482130 [marine sediment metagenome]|uniref:Uncharacterized protein n=1 Tax=marine sediment metagenome TaxID=412755 RepID=A0A0F9B792_9ZZZZ